MTPAIHAFACDKIADARLKAGHDVERSVQITSGWTSALDLLLAPGREGVVEGTLAGRALLDGDDGAALVGIDQRDIEP